MSVTRKVVDGKFFFDKILGEFSNCVDKGKYSRIPYHHWSFYKWHAESPLNDLIIEFDKSVNNVFIYRSPIDDEQKYLYRYRFEDDSLGSFLCDKYHICKEEDEKVADIHYATNTNGQKIMDWDNADYTSLTLTSDTSGNWITTTTAVPTVSTSSTYTYTNYDEVARLRQEVNELKDELKEFHQKETPMKGFKFDFGPCSSDTVRLSMYGLAVQNTSGTWVSYDASQHTIIDVDILNFNGGNYMYKIPVAIKDIKPGDMIVHNRVPMFVLEVKEDNVIAIDVRAGEEKAIIPTRNMFGFDFVTKIVSLFDITQNAPTADQPFGNMLPFLMLADDDRGEIDPAMILLMQSQGGGIDMSNPMLMYFLLNKDGNNDNLLPLLMLGQMNK